MQMQTVVFLSLFALVIVMSVLFQLIIILDFRSTLVKRSAFYRAIGSPESVGSWKTLSLWYVLVLSIVYLGTGLLFIFQPHLY